VITEHSLTIPNVYNGLKIKGSGASVEDRHPLTDEHIAIANPCYQDDPLAWALFITLIDTGARLSEIVGLEVQDVNLQERSVTIRPNGIRGLKTKGAHRTLPLSQRAAETLQEHSKGKEYGGGLYSPTTLVLVAMMLPLPCR
jgi:integrase